MTAWAALWRDAPREERAVLAILLTAGPLALAVYLALWIMLPA